MKEDRQFCTEQCLAILEVSESVSLNRDLTALFLKIAKQLPCVVKFDYIEFILNDREKNIMQTHTLGTGDGERDPDGPVEISLAGGLVLKTQQPLIVPHPDKETRFPKVAEILRTIGVQALE